MNTSYFKIDDMIVFHDVDCFSHIMFQNLGVTPPPYLRHIVGLTHQKLLSSIIVLTLVNTHVMQWSLGPKCWITPHSFLS